MSFAYALHKATAWLLGLSSTFAFGLLAPKLDRPDPSMLFNLVVGSILGLLALAMYTYQPQKQVM